MNWQELRIRAESQAVDTITNVLHELGVGGVAIEDATLIKKYISEGIWDYHEFPEDKMAEDKVIIKAYLPVNDSLPTKIEDIKNELDYVKFTYFPEGEIEMSLAQVKEEDWANSWKAYYKPEKIGEKIVIKPSWEEYEPKEGEVILELDPGMAFGTGNHPTTAMCIKALEKYLPKALDRGDLVYDVGTGSGVLAIATALLGAEKITAVDIDEVAVTVAKENVVLNHVEDKIEVLQGNLLDLVTEPASLIVANIIADIIILVSPDVKARLKEDGFFIASGIIKDRREEVIEALKKVGLKLVETIEEGEWVALVATMEV